MGVVTKGLTRIFRLRMLAGILCAGGLSGLTAIIAVGYALSAPVPRIIGADPVDINAETIEISSTSGSTLHGWFVPGTPGQGIVILMHGVHADRSSQLGRLRLLKHHGYAVLAFDFQAHGESPGQHITFGHLEGLDALAAVHYLRKRFPDERIGIIAESMGGAAAILSPQPLPVDAIVLESVYPDINHALCHRLEIYLGPPGCLLTPLYMAFMPLVIDVNASELRPIDHIGAMKAPLMVVAGTADDRTSVAESKDLFAHAPEPKEFWAVEGAGHVDLQKFAPDDYERHIIPFLGKYLR